MSSALTEKVAATCRFGATLKATRAAYSVSVCSSSDARRNIDIKRALSARKTNRVSYTRLNTCDNEGSRQSLLEREELRPRIVFQHIEALAQIVDAEVIGTDLLGQLVPG